jgi:hypothetical protein
MKINYKDFYHFISIRSPYLIDLWNDINDRPDPKEGDMFRFPDPNINNIELSIMHTYPMKIGKYVKVEFDPEFKNGVAFYYVFDCNGEIYKIHSINDVEDPSKLTLEDQLDLFGFWTKCTPILENYKNEDNESL